jgi:hypothetical protein
MEAKMANELTISATVKWVESGVTVNRSVGGLRIDTAGLKHYDAVQEIGTSEEAITLGEAGAGGYVFLENMSATNYIEIRPATGVADLIKLLPGDVALFRLTGDSVPYAIANTAPCNMRVTIIPL